MCYLQSVNVFRFSYEGLFGEMIPYNTSLRVPSVFPMVSSIHLKKENLLKMSFIAFSILFPFSKLKDSLKEIL